MATIPQIIREAWENREGPAVFGTVSKDGIPNIVYIGSVTIYSDCYFVIADNYFDKTRRNIEAVPYGTLLFIDKNKKAYQLKGSLEYHREGGMYAQMKATNPPQHPGHAAVALHVEEAYCGAQRLC